jgi:hypothetical protein
MAMARLRIDGFMWFCVWFVFPGFGVSAKFMPLILRWDGGSVNGDLQGIDKEGIQTCGRRGAVEVTGRLS